MYNMFNTPYNQRVRQGCLSMDRRKIDNMTGIESGDTFEGLLKGSSYGGDKMMGGRRNKHKNTREEEYVAVAKTDISPQNTNLPRGNSTSTLNSKLYLPIKRSGAFQTPANVLQFYHNGGIQGQGIGEKDLEKDIKKFEEKDIEKVEGGAVSGGELTWGWGEKGRNVIEDLPDRMSELFGYGVPSMKRLLGKLKKKLKGGAWHHSLMSGLKLFQKHLPAIIEHAPTVIDGVQKVKSFFGGKRAKVLKKEATDKLVDMGCGEYEASGSFHKMLGGLMPSVDTPSKTDFLLDKKEGGDWFGDMFPVLGAMGAGKDKDGGSILGDFNGVWGDFKREIGKGKKKGKGRKIGGYDINILPPKGVEPKIEDLRGTVRQEQDRDSDFKPEGGKKRVKKVKEVKVVEAGKLSKAKLRGMAVSKLMKEKGMKLGEASKYLASMERKHGGGWFDTFMDRTENLVNHGMQMAPLFI